MKGIDDDRKAAFFLSSFVFGLSAYSYGTSYFFLFFFVVAALVYLFLKKRVRAGGALIYLCIIGCMSLPIIAFVYINLTGGESIRFLCFTIPKLTQDRFQAVTNIFSDTFFLQSLLNIAKGLGIVLLQYDFLPWNAVPFFGTLYLVSLPFHLYRAFQKAQRREFAVRDSENMADRRPCHADHRFPEYQSHQYRLFSADRLYDFRDTGGYRGKTASETQNFRAVRRLFRALCFRVIPRYGIRRSSKRNFTILTGKPSSARLPWKARSIAM